MTVTVHAVTPHVQHTDVILIDMAAKEYFIHLSVHLPEVLMTDVLSVPKHNWKSNAYIIRSVNFCSHTVSSL